MTQERGSAILTVRVGATEAAVIESAPVEVRPVVALPEQDAVVVFEDPAGTKHVHDLSAAVAAGNSWIHLSVRVHENLAVQADALLGDTDGDLFEGRSKYEIAGLRFQPFFLSGSTVDPAQFVGQSLFVRGFHFPGQVTPGNVSLSCICDSCRKSFRLQSFHAGMDASAYFYCSRGPHTLVVPGGTAGAPIPLVEPDPASLATFEATLPSCEVCGGAFAYRNPLLCPHCSAPYIDFEAHPEIRANEYYGNYLHGDQPISWSPPAED